MRPDRFPSLPVENAALLADLVRVACSLVYESEDLGELDANELRSLHERVVRYYNFDLTIVARRFLEARLRDQT